MTELACAERTALLDGPVLRIGRVDPRIGSGSHFLYRSARRVGSSFCKCNFFARVCGGGEVIFLIMTGRVKIFSVNDGSGRAQFSVVRGRVRKNVLTRNFEMDSVEF